MKTYVWMAAAFFQNALLPAQDYRPDRAPLAWSDTAILDQPALRTDDADGEYAASAEWEDILRTAELDPERATDWKKRKPNPPEPRGKMSRIGCICMDGFQSEATGRGACSTRGGVRFWVLGDALGDTMHWPTLRHKGHPEPLTEIELQQLAAHNPDLQASRSKGKRNYWDFAIAALGSATLLVVLRLLTGGQTLHVFIHPPEKKEE